MERSTGDSSPIRSLKAVEIKTVWHFGRPCIRRPVQGRPTDRSSHYRVRLPLFVGLHGQSSPVPYFFACSPEERTRLVSWACLASDRTGKIWFRRAASPSFCLAFLWLLLEANATGLPDVLYQ
jgi:hypothetical protein